MGVACSGGLKENKDQQIKELRAQHERAKAQKDRRHTHVDDTRSDTSFMNEKKSKSVILTEMDGIESDEMCKIEKFGLSILEDMSEEFFSQQKKDFVFGNCLKRALPSDRASSGSTVIFNQLVKSIGVCPLDAHVSANRESEQQSRNVFCAVAASGMGKTHMVYALGSEGSAYPILIRVCTQLGELTKPWRSLSDSLVRIQQTTTGQLELDASREAMLHVKLLIYCYVEASLVAVEVATKMGCVRLPEFLLRFHRNDKVEDIVKELYSVNCEKFLSSDYFSANRDSVMMYERRIIAWASRLPTLSQSSIANNSILLCFDEIQGLGKSFSGLFSKLTSDDQYDKRPLIYAVLFVMGHLTFSSNITCFMTSTAFSISKLNLSDMFPAKGGKLLKIPPTIEFEVRHMKDILDYYWKISIDEDIERALQDFRGRPLLFMDGVFAPLCHAMMLRGPSSAVDESQMADEIDKIWFMGIIEQGRAGLVVRFRNTMECYLRDDPKPLPSDLSITTASFVSVLVEKYLFHNEVDTLPQCAEAIRCGLLGTSDGSTQFDEPIVKEGIIAAINFLLVTDFMSVLKGFLPRNAQLNGKAVEKILAVDLALRARRSILLQYELNLNLSEYCQLLGDDGNVPELERFSVSPNIRPVSCSTIDLKGKTFFRAFLNNNQVVDTSCIFYDLPEPCGGDIAFVALHTDGEASNRLAVIQVKTGPINLDDLCLTLHPGTQYLQSYPRKILLAGLSPWRGTQFTSSVTELQDHIKLFTDPNCPPALKNWIRMAIIGGRVCPTVNQTLKELRDSTESSDVLVCLSMNQDSWLPTLVRDRFIKNNPTVMAWSDSFRSAVISVDELVSHCPRVFHLEYLQS